MTAIPAVTLEDDDLYPESDGEPMAETELHLEEMIYLIEALKERFQDRPDVFVGGNLLFYYRKGDPSAVVAPDAFVVPGIPKRLPRDGRRRKYLLWQEGKAPCFVAELTSESTRTRDLKVKRDLYEQLGVDEYFLFDPFGEYLDPRLQGFRLAKGRYQPVTPEPDGSLVSTATRLVFSVEGDHLRLKDAATGAPLLRREEEAATLRAEVEARRAAEERARALEEELARLRPSS